jgi:hypothetical protein
LPFFSFCLQNWVFQDEMSANEFMLLLQDPTI